MADPSRSAGKICSAIHTAEINRDECGQKVNIEAVLRCLVVAGCPSGIALDDIEGWVAATVR
jgi:hypothetical protein